MIGLPAGTRIRIVAGVTNMRNGFNGLALKVEIAIREDPFCGHVFVLRGRRGDMIKLLWSTGDGLCLLTKRLERGRFAWPSARDGKVFLTPAQLDKRRRMQFGHRSEKVARRIAALKTRLDRLNRKNDAYSGRVNDPAVPRPLRQTRIRKPFPYEK